MTAREGSVTMGRDRPPEKVHLNEQLGDGDRAFDPSHGQLLFEVGQTTSTVVDDVLLVVRHAPAVTPTVVGDRLRRLPPLLQDLDLLTDLRDLLHDRLLQSSRKAPR